MHKNFNAYYLTLELARAKTRGLTQKKLSEMSGVSMYQITNWKTGRSLPKPEDLKKVLDVLKLDIASVYTGDKQVKYGKTRTKEEEDIDILLSIFKGLKDTKTRERLLDVAFSLWKQEAELRCKP